MQVGGKIFSNSTYVMAIINLTEDSFWRESRATADDLLYRVERAVNEGAAVIDLGAQSTRPGYTEIPAEREIERLIKPVREIKRRFDIPVSVDTYFPECARAVLNEGADMINDIWGLTRDGMAEVIAKYGASVCIMHNSETQLTGDIFPQITEFLQDGVSRALGAGINKEKICLDGGIGFAKAAAQCRELLDGYERLSVLGYPLLLGASRKSMFGGRVEDRLPATLLSTRLAVRKKVLFVRVHDVKENAQVIREESEKL